MKSIPGLFTPKLALRAFVIVVAVSWTVAAVPAKIQLRLLGARWEKSIIS